MALQAVFALLTYLLLTSLSRPMSECPPYPRAADNLYYNGSIYIEDSIVKLRWNFQNEMNIITITITSSCTDTAAIAKNCYDTYTVGSCNVLDVSKATLNTVCTLCWYYTYPESTKDRFQLQPLNFSFVSYCTNRTYNITPTTQSFIIPRDSVGCFFCSLPGGAAPNGWSYNGVIINETSYFNGSLLVSNTSNVFSNSILDSILTCNDTVSMNFLQAHIIFKASLLTGTGYLSNGTASTIWPSTSSAFIYQDFSNHWTSARSQVEYTTEQAGTDTTIGLAIQSTYMNEDEISSVSLIASTPFLQDADTSDVSIVIGASFLTLLMIIFATTVIISIKIWFSKNKKDVIDLNRVIPEHLKIPSQLQHTASVTTQLDKLEWETTTPSFPMNALSLSQCNSVSGNAQASMHFELHHRYTESSYLQIIHDIPCNVEHDALQSQLPLQRTVCHNPLEISLTLYPTKHASSKENYNCEVPINHLHLQTKGAILNSHSEYIPGDLDQSPFVNNAIELLLLSPGIGQIDCPTSNEIHSSNMNGFSDSSNPSNDTTSCDYFDYDDEAAS